MEHHHGVRIGIESQAAHSLEESGAQGVSDCQDGSRDVRKVVECEEADSLEDVLKPGGHSACSLGNFRLLYK